MIGVRILPATWRDTLDVAALERACFQDDAWPLPDVFLALIDWRSIRVKAMVGDRLAGFLAASPDRRHGQAWITTLGVHPDFQHRGIGARLLETCEVQVNLPRLRLTVRQSNAPARSLYGKLGYRDVGIWRQYYQGGEDGIVMEKRLGGD